MLFNFQISLSPAFSNKLQNIIKSLYSRLDADISNAFAYGEKIYTGVGGIALLKLLNDERNKFDSKALDVSSININDYLSCNITSFKF